MKMVGLQFLRERENKIRYEVASVQNRCFNLLKNNNNFTKSIGLNKLNFDFISEKYKIKS